MILPDWQKLWKPYAIDGCTIEMFLEWITKRANAPQQIVDKAFRDLFLELASGREFSTTGCDPNVCSCGLKNAHTEINHYLLRRTKELKSLWHKKFWESLQEIQQKEILLYIEKLNAEYISKHSKPSWYKKMLLKFEPYKRDLPPTT